MLNIVVPADKVKIAKQIKALRYLISIDSNDKDLAIHKAALLELEKALERINYAPGYNSASSFYERSL